MMNLRKLSVFSILWLTAVATAQASDDRFTTNYDRSNDSQRETPWKKQEVVEGRQQSVTGTSVESSARPVDSTSLSTSFERISQDPGYIAVENTVDDHTQRISDLENMVFDMEVATSWIELPPSPEDWGPGAGGASATLWNPAISTQTSDFTQSRSVTSPYERTVNVYEENSVTGEKRLIDSYTETEARTNTESRLIDVARSAAGGADGWSSWATIRGPYSCGAYSPDPSTVNQGQTFTQSANCYLDQKRDIFYLTSGNLLETNSDTRRISTTVTRTATGTKPLEECRYTSSTYMYSINEYVQTDRDGDFVRKRVYHFLEWGNSKVWDGYTFLYNRNDPVVPVYTKSSPYTGASGYNYYIGPYSHTRRPTTYYQICRIPK